MLLSECGHINFAVFNPTCQETSQLFAEIPAGVEFAGTIRHAGPHEERAVILGSLTGEIHWNGILQVPAGGKVIVQGALRCREMMIGGEIVGEGDDVLIETGLLRLGNSPRIENYLGFPAGISGGDLTRRAVTQARRFGTEVLTTTS